MRGGFFQVDRDAWQKVVTAGLNAAVCYLVLACGTGRDNRTTAWSINAIEKYTSVGRGMAKRALAALIELGALARLQEGTRPRYFLERPEAFDGHSDDVSASEGGPNQGWIWLPNTLVTGAAGECPPLERIRGLQDVRTLCQFIALYDAQNLPEDGGIHWRQVRRAYSRTALTERGHWVIWAFSRGSRAAATSLSARQPFWQEEQDADGFDLGRAEFWESWNNLERLGLLECVPHLVEADNDDAAIICPCPGEEDPGTPEERALGRAARHSARELLGRFPLGERDSEDVIIPVPDRFPKVELVGVYRLRYRPHTAMTAAWIAKSKTHHDWRAEYEALSGIAPASAMAEAATSR